MICKTRNIKKSFYLKGEKKIDVLKGVDIEIFKNDFIALMGASGSGKSTLMHCLGGLERIDDGSIEYMIEDKNIQVETLSDFAISNFRNKSLGFVLQAHQLLPEFTALENIMIPSIIAGMSKANSKANAQKLMDRVNMGDRANHKPDELSGGEQQRIAIARALINEPSLLFADEPTGSLDDTNSKNIIVLLKELRDEFNLTCLIATHSNEIAKAAEKIYYIKDGLVNND